MKQAHTIKCELNLHMRRRSVEQASGCSLRIVNGESMVLKLQLNWWWWTWNVSL